MLAAALITAGCGGSDTTVGSETPPVTTDQTVVLQTNLGDITLELDAGLAPLTVENFLLYAQQGHYDGTIFHRVIAGFMVQGGGYTADFTRKDTFDPVANEADNGLKNNRYTIAMARTSDPQSATAQFFINVADNSALDYVAPTDAGWG
ncbi:MAG: peptidylprolyl isomerase, partial [Pseudomonadota bacterium]